LKCFNPNLANKLRPATTAYKQQLIKNIQKNLRIFITLKPLINFIFKRKNQTNHFYFYKILIFSLEIYAQQPHIYS
jgi:hypothetical protein